MTPHMTQAIASRLKLDHGRIYFVLRTFVAAAAALYLALIFGLEHPNWAVMGALAASQSTRERLYLRGAMRAAGSIIGAFAGVLILLITNAEPFFIIAFLSIWVGTCVAGSIILRGLFSYFAVVSSFTAAMVVLLVSGNPDDVWILGTDRMLTSLVGVATAWIIGALFAPRAGSPYNIDYFNNTLAGLFGHLAQRYQPQQAENHLFSLMKMEARLNTEGDGSRRRNLHIRAFRRSLTAMLALALYHGRKEKSTPSITSAHLKHMQSQLQAGGTLSETLPLLRQSANSAEADDPTLANYLQKLALELEALLKPSKNNNSTPLYLHYDWHTAKIAFLRVLIAFWGLGLIWILTGWEAAAYLIISATVMLSVFSSADQQLNMIRQASIGQVIGISFGLLCIALIWPFSTSVWMATIPVMVILFFAFVAWAHPRLTIVCYDFIMSMMLMLNPWLFAETSLKTALPVGIAIFSGPLLVWLLFHFLLPVDSNQKAESIRRLIRHELEAMARRFDKIDLERQRIWHARLYQRLLRLAQLHYLSRNPLGSVAAEGMAWFDLADSIAMLHSIHQETVQSPRLKRASTLALQRLEHLSKNSKAAARALKLVLKELPEDNYSKETMQRAANFLARQ